MEETRILSLELELTPWEVGFLRELVAQHVSAGTSENEASVRQLRERLDRADAQLSSFGGW